MKKRLFCKKGFTLIEIMTTVVIISILISITIPNFYLFIKSRVNQQDMAIAEVIYNSSQNVLNDIKIGRYKVTFPKTNNNIVIEKTYITDDKNNSSSTTPIKQILCNSSYINGVDSKNWDNSFKNDFLNNTEIVYDSKKLIMISVKYKNIDYAK